MIHILPRLEVNHYANSLLNMVERLTMPSKFGGGDLLIHHGGPRQTFSFGEARSQRQPQYVAFFADCEHEVKKVTSGVRVCLAFNLILKPERNPRKAKSDSPVDSSLLNQVASWFQRRPATFPSPRLIPWFNTTASSNWPFASILQPWDYAPLMVLRNRRSIEFDKTCGCE